MHHDSTDADFDVTLCKLRLFATTSEITIQTVDTQTICCGTGSFVINTPNAYLIASKAGADSGFIDMRTSGPKADIVFEANSKPDCASLLTVNSKGILGVYGNPLKPGFIRLDDSAVTLGKGVTLPGPLLGGKISLTDTSVVIQAGITKISVTKAGVVMEVGPTKFELCPLSGIKLTAGPVSSLNIGLADIEAKCAENTIQLNAIQAKIDAATVDVKAQVKAAINGLLAEMKAQGMLDQSAPLLNL